MEGWIKLYRAIQSNDLWTSEPFSRGQAWVDLLLSANHKESFFYKRGNKVIVKRGQVGRSEVELSDRWKWSRTKVRKFLKDQEKEQQIKIAKSRITQVLTIVNYDVYQEKEQQTGQQKDSKSTTEEQQKNIYKNEEKEKNVNNEKNKKEREEALSQIQDLQAQNKKLKSQLALKAENKKLKEKSSEKKEGEPMFGPEDFDENGDLVITHSYQIDLGGLEEIVPPPVSAHDRAPKTASDSDKPYKMALSGYLFEGWTQKLKEAFILYCEVKHDNGAFGATQVKMRISEITQAMEKHEMPKIISLIKEAANGSWADFQFDKRIKEREVRAKKNSSEEIDHKSPLFCGSESLEHKNVWNIPNQES